MIFGPRPKAVRHLWVYAHMATAVSAYGALSFPFVLLHVWPGMSWQMMRDGPNALWVAAPKSFGEIWLDRAWAFVAGLSTQP